MPSEAVNQRTRREWRDLGFFYDQDNDVKEWRIVGSSAGLRKFAQLVLDYASDPTSVKIGEHVHLGPYAYLEIGTWHIPVITDHWIAGQVPHLHQLSKLVGERMDGASVGEQFKLREAFAPTSPYELILDVRDDAFDPATADAFCW